MVRTPLRESERIEYELVPVFKKIVARLGSRPRLVADRADLVPANRVD